METGETQPAGKCSKAEERIAWLTLALGFGAAISFTAFISWKFGVGIAAGAVLAWVNFRWLRGAMDALVALSAAQSGAEKSRVSPWSFVKLFARYALIAAILYVIVTRFGIPLVSLLGGLCALGAAAIAGSLYEVLHGPE